ncbi:class I SAM-dependent methyltransferase [Nakamurella antarctica]|uniref:Demethylmenaquinone methyltransferase n=1 Tax=Nakamurella antarctica TaxID=1902245 RepID=A0A3G8ZPL6_9ACTN|nr:class I SAM-dependent methyltransferase [Nakamurella antarctica]AZI58745.1 class I SAM-dependent methyltransferase [Nakamurella antarctica]
MGRAGLEKDPQQVAGMFDEVADGYDRANTFISFGQDRRWRRHMVRTLQLMPGAKVLDVAAGTAVSTSELATSGVWAVALDFSLGMLRAGSKRQVPKVAGDAMYLPFADGTFDAVTISFGLRNVQNPNAALAEFARVTRPGGQLLVCEVSRPRMAILRFGHRVHLRKVLPMLARRFSTNPEAYTYLGESTEAWMDPKTLAHTIADSGWKSVAWRSMTFGVVALHHAIRDES